MKPSQISKAYRTPSALSLCLLITMATVTACSKATVLSSSTAASVNTDGISGTVSADAITGATVTIYPLNSDGSQGAAIGSTTSDANGNYTINVADQTTPVIVVASGGHYDEENGGGTVNLSSAQIRTVLPSISKGDTVAVTPINEIATQQALTSIGTNNTGSPSAVAALITGANASVATSFGLTNITKPPCANLVNGAAPQSADAAKYAIALGAISQMAATVNAANGGGGTANSLSIMQALATTASYSDGKLGGGQITGGVAVPIPGAPSGVNLTTLLGSQVAGTTNNNTSFASTLSTAMTTFSNNHSDKISQAGSASGIAITKPTVPTTAPPALATLATAAAGTTIALTPPTPPATLPNVSPTLAGPPQTAGVPPPVGSSAIVMSLTCTQSGTAADQSHGAATTRTDIGHGASVFTTAYPDGCVKSEIKQSAMITPTTLNMLTMGISCSASCTSASGNNSGQECTMPTMSNMSGMSGSAPSAPTTQQSSAMAAAVATAISTNQASITSQQAATIAIAAVAAGNSVGSCGSGDSSGATTGNPCQAAFIASLVAAGVKGSPTTGPLSAALIAVQAASPTANGQTGPTPVTWTATPNGTGGMVLTSNTCSMFGITTPGTATMTLSPLIPPPAN